MIRTVILGICIAWVAVGGDKVGILPVAPLESTQTIIVHADEIVPLRVTLKEVTLIVLPEKEKAMGVFVGDRSYWNVDVIPGAERYVAVKASKAGLMTDIHIVTDHDNSYTFQTTEGGGAPVLKVFVQPFDKSTLDKLPVFVSAAELDSVKKQLATSQQELADSQQKAAKDIKAKTDEVRATLPDKMRFDYHFKKNVKPFFVTEAWHDDKFTYIRANPTEAPALYEKKDGQPNLIQFEMKPDGLYFVPKVLDMAYLQAGKDRLDIWK
jgi:type IV secretory pathway VirB9-like protein